MFYLTIKKKKKKNQPALPETQVRSLGRDHPLEKGMATHSSNPAWRILWTEKPGGLQSMGLDKAELFHLLTPNFGDRRKRIDLSATQRIKHEELVSWTSRLEMKCLGLPRWLSGIGSTCQCRGHMFDPWSRKTPQAAEQLSPSRRHNSALCSGA